MNRHIRDEIVSGFHRYDEYAARILCELRSIRAPKKQWNWKDFLIKFTFKKKTSEQVAQDPEITKKYLHIAMGLVSPKEMGPNDGTRTTGTPDSV